VDIAANWPAAARRELLSVRPGITSPASIIYRNEDQQLIPGDLMHDYLAQVMPSKLRLDLLYLRSCSVVSDIDVLLWTAVALLPALRQAAIPQSRLLFGPFARLYARHLRWFGLDASVAFLAVGLAGVAWRLQQPLNLGLGLALGFAVLAAWVFTLFNFAFGLHRVEWSRAPWQHVFLLGISNVLTVGLLLGVNTLPHKVFIPDFMLLLSGFLAFIGFTVTRYRERLLTGTAARWINLRGGVRGLGERVLVVGAGENFTLAAGLLNRREWANVYTIVGIVDDDLRSQGRLIEGYRVLGFTTQIPELVKKLDIGLILYTVEDILAEDRRRILNLCRQASAQLVMLPASLDHFRMQMSRGCSAADLGDAA
jgi:hypothetical protein